MNKENEMTEAEVLGFDWISYYRKWKEPCNKSVKVCLTEIREFDDLNIFETLLKEQNIWYLRTALLHYFENYLMERKEQSLASIMGFYDFVNNIYEHYMEKNFDKNINDPNNWIMPEQELQKLIKNGE
ncbi:hypothetical protein LCGC14_2295750 [marine sediment metagenome]|uniref:Uncharacterized protein n=1 Tax=marine sediment metagenome TaxID=412755 RepID=A0A0F9CPX6_9ZZZZ